MSNQRFPEPVRLKDFKRSGLFLFILALLTIVSLLLIVQVQHEIRHLESRYYQTMQQTLVAKEDWGRLKLEQEHLTSPAMVEKIAKEQLNMTLDKSRYEYVYLSANEVNTDSVETDISQNLSSELENDSSNAITSKTLEADNEN